MRLGRGRLLPLLWLAGVFLAWVQVHTIMASLTLSESSESSKGQILAQQPPSLSLPLSLSATTPPPRNNSNSSSGNNKTLVILMGNLRGGETAWRTLYENVLDVNNADLGLMIGENSTRAAYQNATLFDRAKFHWTFPEYEDWADAFDLIPNTTGWRERVLPITHNQSTILGGVQHGGLFRGSGGIIFMIRWFLAQKLIELDLTSVYDRFVITRADHYYLCRHDLSELSKTHLWIPGGSDFGGVTDRHLVVSSRNVLKALDVLAPLLKDPTRYKRLLEQKLANPEMVLMKSWIHQGLKSKIRRFKRVMFTCGETGDMTRWQKLGKQVKEGVRLKYGREYRMSKKTCQERH